jgi:ATP-dependent RNA helicase SUPV3L1/SUV3
MKIRVTALCAEPDDAFTLGEDGVVLWSGSPVARLRPGPEILSPALVVPALDWLTVGQRQLIHGRLSAWFDAYRRQRLGALSRAGDAGLSGAPRGLLFQLRQGLGSVPRRSAREQIDALSQDDRRALRRLGVRIGRHSVYFPALLKPTASALRAVLWCVAAGPEMAPALPRPGATSVAVDASTPEAFYEAVGYRVCGGIAVRLDVLERLAGEVWERSKKGSFEVSGPLLNLLGCTRSGMAEVLSVLGYTPERDEETGRLLVARGNPPRSRRSRPVEPSPGRPRGRLRPDAGSPFAELARLKRKG